MAEPSAIRHGEGQVALPLPKDVLGILVSYLPLPLVCQISALLCTKQFTEFWSNVDSLYLPESREKLDQRKFRANNPIINAGPAIDSSKGPLATIYRLHSLYSDNNLLRNVTSLKGTLKFTPQVAGDAYWRRFLLGILPQLVRVSFSYETSDADFPAEAARALNPAKLQTLKFVSTPDFFAEFAKREWPNLELYAGLWPQPPLIAPKLQRLPRCSPRLSGLSVEQRAEIIRQYPNLKFIDVENIQALHNVAEETWKTFDSRRCEALTGVPLSKLRIGSVSVFEFACAKGYLLTQALFDECHSNDSPRELAKCVYVAVYQILRLGHRSRGTLGIMEFFGAVLQQHFLEKLERLSSSTQRKLLSVIPMMCQFYTIAQRPELSAVLQEHWKKIVLSSNFPAQTVCRVVLPATLIFYVLSSLLHWLLLLLRDDSLAWLSISVCQRLLGLMWDRMTSEYDPELYDAILQFVLRNPSHPDMAPLHSQLKDRVPQWLKSFNRNRRRSLTPCVPVMRSMRQLNFHGEYFSTKWQAFVGSTSAPELEARQMFVCSFTRSMLMLKDHMIQMVYERDNSFANLFALQQSWNERFPATTVPGASLDFLCDKIWRGVWLRALRSDGAPLMPMIIVALEGTAHCNTPELFKDPVFIQALSYNLRKKSVYDAVVKRLNCRRCTVPVAVLLDRAEQLTNLYTNYKAWN